MEKRKNFIEELEKAKMGDNEAFQFLLDEYMPLIIKYANISFYNAEECKQELIVLFWKSLNKVRIEEIL